MSAVRDFLASLKEDLLDRRLLPFLAALAVALVAAVAYAALAGGGSTSGPPAVLPVPSGAPAAAVGHLAVTQAPANPNQPISETTNGASKQHHGLAHDPFARLPEANNSASGAASHAGSAPAGTSTATRSATPTSGSPITTSKSSGSASTPPPATGTSPSSAGGTTPAAKPTTPAKPKVSVHYRVTAQLGLLPTVTAGTPVPAPKLTTYKHLALDQPLPNKVNQQVMFLGVVPSGKGALFGFTGAAILHGSASCQPSATQCQAIELQVGESETLEVAEPDGSTATYELKLVSIDKRTSAASAARTGTAARAQAKAALVLARHVPGLRYSTPGAGLVLLGLPAVPAPVPTQPR